MAGLAPGQTRRGRTSVACMRWVTGRAHSEGCCGGSPLVPRLHSGSQYWEGRRPPECPCLSGAMGELGRLEGLCRS